MTRFSRLIESIGQQRDKVIEYQTRMTELPALGPENGGTGEMPKALYLALSDIFLPSAPHSVHPSGKPCKRSHSTGVSLRIRAPS